MSMSERSSIQRPLLHVLLVLIAFLPFNSNAQMLNNTKTNANIDRSLSDFSRALLKKMHPDHLSIQASSQRYSTTQIHSELEQRRYMGSMELSGHPYLFKNEKYYSNDTSCINTLIELFFPLSAYGTRELLELAFVDGYLDPPRFQLAYLDLSNNKLSDSFLGGFSQDAREAAASLTYTTPYTLLLAQYFAPVRLFSMSHNHLKRLTRAQFELFGTQMSHLEALLLNANEIKSIQHDTFGALVKLRFLDLSSNQLLLIHPLTLGIVQSSLVHLNLADNLLRAVFRTTPQSPPPVIEPSSNETNSSSTDTLPFDASVQFENLRYLHLSGNTNVSCDCGLAWLFALKSQLLFLDEFTCVRNSSDITPEQLLFDSIENESFLADACEAMGPPRLMVNNRELEETSKFSLFRSWSKRWFAWHLLKDILPVTTPYPMLMSADEQDKLEKDQREQRIFYSWHMSDVTLNCTAAQPGTPIIWKTQFGYLTYMDKELMASLSDNPIEEIAGKCDLSSFDNNATEFANQSSCISDVPIAADYYGNFKIFYKMNRLTKLSRNITVRIGRPLGAQTVHDFAVNERQQLTITNMRVTVAGSFVCIAVNAEGISTYDYALHVRSGVGETFLYSLFVSMASGLIPAILGIFICCYCEYEADKNYPMTPPCYPTPQVGATPPNFDFNEWMASYLPNIKISDTLEQVSKKLRKGMEKASVTVKSLGVTSSAYIYSMYEHSSQRLADMKSYVPTINVDMKSYVPSLKYPPVGQFATRMRMGMGNMFNWNMRNMREFRGYCGSSDLTHTPSIIDIEHDTNTSHAISQTYILDQLDLQQQQARHYRMLNQMINDETLGRPLNKRYHLARNDINYCLEAEDKAFIVAHAEQQPTTSSSIFPIIRLSGLIEEEKTPTPDEQPMQDSKLTSLINNELYSKRSPSKSQIKYLDDSNSDSEDTEV